MENMKEKTMKELMEDLEIDLAKKANERIDKKIMKYSRPYRKSTRCDAYEHIDDILLEELRKNIKDAPLRPDEVLSISCNRWEDRNCKNRCIRLVYKFENQTQTIASLSLDVTVKKAGFDIFKVNNIERDSLNCSCRMFDNKTLPEAIEYARELIKDKIVKMRNVELPELIDKTEQEFAEIIKSMRRGESIKSPWFYEKIYKQYFDLRRV